MIFDLGRLPPSAATKLLHAAIVPRPIAWVVTQSKDGLVNAAPYSFFNAVSSDPPLVCLGINKSIRPDGTLKDTAHNILTTRQFVINLVSEEMGEKMNQTGYAYAAGQSEIAEVGLETIASSHVTPPRIAGCPVALEAELFQSLDVGANRTLVIGKILAIHVEDRYVIDRDKCYLDSPKFGLIGRMHGDGVFARTTDLFTMAKARAPE